MSGELRDVMIWEVTEQGRERGFDILEGLGFIPTFISANSEDGIAKQIDNNYQHGGGWRHYDGFKMGSQHELISQYPEDPPLFPLAIGTLRGEKLYFYDYAWCAVVQEDGTFEVARID